MGGGGGVEQREQWKDPLGSQPREDNQLSQTNRNVRIGVWRSVRGGCAPSLIQALARSPRAPRDEAPEGLKKPGKKKR